MSETYVSGQFAKVKVGTTPIELPAGKWDLDLSGNNVDIPNSKDGRLRIKGLSDAKGNVQMPYDTGNDPTVTANGGITDGAIITLKLFVDTTHFYQLAAIIDNVKPSSEVTAAVMLDVAFSLQSGTVTYPVYP
jgi:hypothetical protein